MSMNVYTMKKFVHYFSLQKVYSVSACKICELDILLPFTFKLYTLLKAADPQLYCTHDTLTYLLNFLRRAKCSSD